MEHDQHVCLQLRTWGRWSWSSSNGWPLRWKRLAHEGIYVPRTRARNFCNFTNSLISFSFSVAPRISETLQHISKFANELLNRLGSLM